MDEALEAILIYAERYALGRRTYAVTDVASYLKPRIQQISTKTLGVLNEDLQSMADKVAQTGIDGLWGMACDKREWQKLWSAVKVELAIRREEHADGDA